MFPMLREYIQLAWAEETDDVTCSMSTLIINEKRMYELECQLPSWVPRHVYHWVRFMAKRNGVYASGAPYSHVDKWEEETWSQDNSQLPF